MFSLILIISGILIMGGSSDDAILMPIIGLFTFIFGVFSAIEGSTYGKN